MTIRLRNAVVLAEDYESLRDWWVEVVGLEVLQEWTDTYHYAELGSAGRHVVGIGDAKEMGVAPPTPRTNAVVPRLEMEDVDGFLARIREGGGEVLFGPHYSRAERMHYGGFADVEGNQVWVGSPAL